jgi:peptidoglycan hydrolase CwlO-like protein
MPTLHPKRRSARRWFAALALVAAVLAAPGGAGADTPQQQREKVRQQKADLAAQLDALNADHARVEQALADLRANVAGQEAALADVRRQADQARAEADAARAAEAATVAHIEDLRAHLRTAAVTAYVGSGQPEDLVAQDTGTVPASDRLLREAYAAAQGTRTVTIVDGLRVAEHDLGVQRATAEAATAEAERKAAEIDGRLAELRAARDQQKAFAAQVESRIDDNLTEAANLATVDKKLSDQIAAEAAAIARRVPAGGGGGVSRGPIGAPIPLGTTHGITVAASIVNQLDAMLNAADADGISFGGSGYRDPNQQVALRQQNCGSSQYDIYEKSPSQCRPPTARPGQSNHERGLAVDFTYGGSAIQSHSSPGWQWLNAHAGAYGFYNLASEPWHWSVDGT